MDIADAIIRAMTKNQKRLLFPFFISCVIYYAISVVSNPIFMGLSRFTQTLLTMGLTTIQMLTLHVFIFIEEMHARVERFYVSIATLYVLPLVTLFLAWINKFQPDRMVYCFGGGIVICLLPYIYRAISFRFRCRRDEKLKKWKEHYDAHIKYPK